jgi:hypothetical protein
MNRTIALSFIIILCSIRMLSAFESGEHSIRQYNSASWPEFVSYTGSELLAASVGSVTSGTSGLLIRCEPDGRLLVDFGREGRAWVQPEATDFMERSQKLLDGVESKLVGNALRLIGPRLLTYRDDTLIAYAMEDLMERDTFLLFYGQPDEDLIAHLADWSLEHKELLVSRACQPVFMPLKKSTDAYIASVLKKQGESRVPFMRSHLSPLYVEVLQHKPDSPYTAVLVDADGQLLSRSEATDLESFTLSAMIEYLDASPTIVQTEALLEFVDESVGVLKD